MEKVSVIIPTFNRFKYLLNTIKSIQEQTYKNIEIIVINDKSTQKEYYDYNWEGIKIIHLEKNSKELFGCVHTGYIKNLAIKKSEGKYIAFCDDDDIWFPDKLELQINAMKKTGCKMSSTDGLIGKGPHDKNKKYKKYNAEVYYTTIQNIYKNKGSNFLDSDFPDVWSLDFLKIHNCIINSSVILEKSILDKIKGFKKNPRPVYIQDYECWLRALEHTNCVYIKNICFYYDTGHGDGQNWN
jgi:glycosyltransferase involved in cell wall biosynthesis